LPGASYVIVFDARGAPQRFAPLARLLRQREHGYQKIRP
jgi:hypothetical protein